MYLFNLSYKLSHYDLNKVQLLSLAKIVEVSIIAVALG